VVSHGGSELTAESRARHLPLEHLHLVPEHQELDVVLIWSATSGSEETADQEVQEREQHGAPSGSGGRMLPAPHHESRKLNPSGSGRMPSVSPAWPVASHRCRWVVVARLDQPRSSSLVSTLTRSVPEPTRKPPRWLHGWSMRLARPPSTHSETRRARPRSRPDGCERVPKAWRERVMRPGSTRASGLRPIVQGPPSWRGFTALT
jgi:hypothetical protein